MIIRKVKFEDWAFLLRVKNQPDVRKFSIVSKEKIKPEDHKKWLEKTLKDPKVEFWVVQDGPELVGDLRIDRGEISIRIATAFQGKRIAQEMLKKLTRLGMTAKIVEGNIRSMRLFYKVGYRPISYSKGVYIFKCE